MMLGRLNLCCPYVSSQLDSGHFKSARKLVRFNYISGDMKTVEKLSYVIIRLLHA